MSHSRFQEHARLYQRARGLGFQMRAGRTFTGHPLCHFYGEVKPIRAQWAVDGPGRHRPSGDRQGRPPLELARAFSCISGAPARHRGA
jgi:hypothetical protein